MATTITDRILDPQIRGDDFIYSSSLIGLDGGAWTSSMFLGGLRFTLRTVLPTTSITDDTDAAVVDIASVANGDITFSSTTAFTIFIPDARTTLWPSGKLYWDFQGKLTALGGTRTLSRGTIIIIRDVTRTQ
jgi:hypothetical protein